MFGAKIRPHRLEQLGFFVIPNRAPRDINDPGIRDYISPSPSPIQQVLGGLLRR